MVVNGLSMGRLKQLCDTNIRDVIWHVHQGKTGTDVSVPVHPVVLAMVNEHHEWMRKQSVINPSLAVQKTSCDKPWGSGLGASW